MSKIFGDIFIGPLFYVQRIMNVDNKIWLVIIVIIANLFYVSAKPFLEVHLIPHSHCDPGWRDTFEGYFYSKVSKILTNTILELTRDPSRTFVWAEVSFFELWYRTQSAEVRANVTKLIANRQFEFVAGGWVQNDEANAHYHQVIDQLTEGHQYLWDNFKIKPNIAWQIDPFGHSSVTPSLFAKAGFDAVVINRIHFQTKQTFFAAKHLEFVWHSLNQPDTKLLAHVLPRHYSLPAYDFEHYELPDDWPGEARYFANKYLRELAQPFATNTVMVLWGDDFRFMNADRQFRNMDGLIKMINADPSLNMTVQYSTPARYFAALNRKGTAFPSYLGDFFPYADNARSYWTGFYTTRPVLKLHSREVDAMIKSAETALALANHHVGLIPVINGQATLDLLSHASALSQARRDSALVQHHDGITGTARLRVVNDYTARLNDAYARAKEVLASSVSALLYGDTSAPNLDAELRTLDFEYQDAHVIVVHNSLGWARAQFQQLAVRTSADIQVRDAHGTLVSSQFTDWHQLIPADPTRYNREFVLHFLATVPPLGVETYFLRRVEGSTIREFSVPTEAYTSKNGNYNGYPVHSRFEVKTRALKADEATIENDDVRIILAPANGLMGHVINKRTGARQVITQDLLAYSDATDSGAYLMRTKGAPTTLLSAYLVVLYKGEYVQEARVLLNDGLEWRIRLYSSAATAMPLVIEHEYTVAAASATEVVVQFDTRIESQTEFFADNGVEVLRRERTDNVSEHNYYPCVSMAYVQSKDTAQRFTVLTRHSVGVTSPRAGTLELMLHRNLPTDDHRGLMEPNNDYSSVTTTLWTLWQSPRVSDQQARQLSILLNNPMRCLTIKANTFEPVNTADEYKAAFLTSYRPMKHPLPPAVHIVTLRYLSGDEDILLRLINTMESTGLSEYATNITLEVQELFAEFKINFLSEQSLTATRDYDDQEADRLTWSSFGRMNLSRVHLDNITLAKQNSNEEGVFISQDTLEEAGQRKRRVTENEYDEQDLNARIFLGPTQIRTFVVQLVPKEAKIEKFIKSAPRTSVTKPRLELPLQNQPVDFSELPVLFGLAILVIGLLVLSMSKAQNDLKQARRAVRLKSVQGSVSTEKKVVKWQ